jgi:hypothetical protein
MSALWWVQAAKCPAQYAKGELRALKELSQAHPDRFVKYIGLVTLGSASPGDTCFAMEYCAHGSLYDYVRKNGRLGEQKGGLVLHLRHKPYNLFSFGGDCSAVEQSAMHAQSQLDASRSETSECSHHEFGCIRPWSGGYL